MVANCLFVGPWKNQDRTTEHFEFQDATNRSGYRHYRDTVTKRLLYFLRPSGQLDLFYTEDQRPFFDLDEST